MLEVAAKYQFPAGYADKLLNSQIKYKLSHKPTQETIQTLIDLYKQGLSFCKSINSYKHLYFQLKINQIITHNSAMIEQSKLADNTKQFNDNKHTENAKIKPLNSQLIGQVQSFKQEKIQHTKQMVNTSKECNTRMTIKKMISESKIKNLQNKQKVLKQLATQDQILAKKLQKRSRKSSSKFFAAKTQSTVDISQLSKLQNTTVRNNDNKSSIVFGPILEPDSQLHQFPQSEQVIKQKKI